MTKHITVALTEEQAAGLQAAATREDVTVEAVVADLIRRKLDHEARFRAAVEEGLAAIRRGDTLSHQEVVERAGRRASRLLGEAWGSAGLFGPRPTLRTSSSTSPTTAWNPLLGCRPS